jgi:hypothetical protein
MLLDKVGPCSLYLYKYETKRMKEAFGRGLNELIRAHAKCLLEVIHKTLSPLQSASSCFLREHIGMYANIASRTLNPNYFLWVMASEDSLRSRYYTHSHSGVSFMDFLNNFPGAHTGTPRGGGHRSGSTCAPARLTVFFIFRKSYRRCCISR